MWTISEILGIICKTEFTSYVRNFISINISTSTIFTSDFHLHASVYVQSFIIFLLSFATGTSCANYCGPVQPGYVDFSEGGKQKYPEKTPRSTEEINYGHSTWNTTLGFSSEGFNALTVCTLASLKK